MKTLIIVVFASIGLFGCTSPTPNYYTLQEVLEETVPLPSTADYQFEMLGVRMPAQVDLPQLVVRRDQGRLVILESERWATPLADEFHDALTARLERRLGVRDISGLVKDPKRATLSVRVDIRRFESLPGNYALLDAIWRVNLRAVGQAAKVITCSGRFREPADIALSSLVLAHQKIIDELATAIAGNAGKLLIDVSPSCQAL